MPRRPYTLPPLAPLQAFEAAARHLSFTRAADELALTQSAVSRQIQALEEHYGVPLFQRLHRALRLTEEGEWLQRAVVEALQQLHVAGQQLQRGAHARTVVVTTTPGFAGLWLIPRLGRFTAAHAGVDVRISASNALVNLGRDGVDVAIRYQAIEAAGPGALRLFGETVFPVCSPRLLADPSRPLREPADLRHHVLLGNDDGPGTPWADWPQWLQAMRLPELRPAGVLHYSLYDQLIQAAVGGQGVALGRSPLLDDLLAEGRLVAPFGSTMASPRAYHVLRSDAGGRKPEVQAFVDWLLREAQPPGPAAPTARGPDSAAGADRAPP